MNPVDIMRTACAAGVEVTIAESGNLFVRPAESLTPELRALLVEHKAALIGFLREAHETTAELIEAAMVACDHHHDSEAARQAMRDECLALPRHLQADLLDHFRQTYPDKDQS